MKIWSEKEMELIDEMAKKAIPFSLQQAMKNHSDIMYFYDEDQNRWRVGRVLDDTPPPAFTPWGFSNMPKPENYVDEV